MRQPVHAISAALLAACGAAVTAIPAHAAMRCEARSGPMAMPLVELYTSEGCSSCPPADRWLANRIRGDGDGANWLAFHVDYWNELGWPDRFSSAAFTRRQERRVAGVGSTTVYTPQVMVGSQVQVRWNDSAAFAQALAQARGPAGAALVLRVVRADDGAHAYVAGMRAHEAKAGSARLWLAQSVDGQETRVKAGENGGLILRHERVVRQLWGPWRLDDVAVAQRVPLSLDATDWSLTAFVQTDDGSVLQSLRVSASDCR